MTSTKVVTWQSPSGETINVTRSQERKLDAAGLWPRDKRGNEYCNVSRGLHSGHPTYSDADIDAMLAS